MTKSKDERGRKSKGQEKELGNEIREMADICRMSCHCPQEDVTAH
jgi:hypothetical protein